MSDNQQPTGGAGGSNGGAGTGSNAGGDSPQNNGNNSGTPPKMVSWDVHERLLGDVAKAREKNRELEARIGEIESNSLKEKNDYKSLYERSETSKKELEQKLKDQSSWIVQTQQFNEVKAAAVAAGLRKEALDDLDMIDMKGVEVETTSTGRFIVKGAKERVESLKNEKPHWFTTTTPPVVNTGGTGAGEPKPGARLGVADVLQAERDWKRGKITRKQYDDTYARYCKENPKNAIPAGEPSTPSNPKT